MKKISILVPVYNEQDNITFFYNRIKPTLAKLKKNYSYEIIFTNNCSTDNTAAEICKIIENDQNVRLITFSRNFGRNNSQLAGIKNATGELIFMIDVDCQDPPEMLFDFVKKSEEGYEIIYGIRDRSKESIILHLGAKVFYRMTKALADQTFILDMGEFLLFSSKIKNEITRVNTDKPFIRSEISAAGFSKFGINYKREPRKFGESNYSGNFIKLFSYALTGFLSTSTFFLRFSALIGFLVVITDFLLLFINLFTNNLNFQYFISLNLILVIFMLASNSIYIARTHNNLLERSNYIIDENKSKNNKDLI